MSLLSDFKERLAALVLRERADHELDEELRFHLEMETEAGLARGLSPEEARRRAALRLGGVERTKERVRDARGVGWVEDGVRDVRYAVRSLARTPVFTVTATLVLALGIGATTSIFSAVRAVVLRPLAVAEPDQLYALWESNPSEGRERGLLAPANYLDLRERVDAFAALEGYGDLPAPVTLTGLDEPLILDALTVTGGFFRMLGVRPQLGRDFTEAETWAEATWRAGELPLLLSARAWRTRFASDTALVGRAVQYNSTPARIVGVMPDGLDVPSERVDVWAPFGWPGEAREADWFRRSQSIRPVARLADGVSPDRARAELEAVVRRLEQEHPTLNRGVTSGMEPLHGFLLGDTRTPLLLLFGAVGLLLLIACANVGTLLLVRGAARHRDRAVRAALGAGRGRIVRQSLTESAVLAVLGGTLGVTAGVVGSGLLERMQPDGLLRVTGFPLDAGVLVFAVGATAGAALLFGGFPALLGGRTGPGDALRDATRSRGTARGANRVVAALVVAEVALAALLVLGAGLLVRSAVELGRVDPGFRPAGVLVVSLDLPGRRYPDPASVHAFTGVLTDRVAAIPGVTSVALSSSLPLRDPGRTGDLAVAGSPDAGLGSQVLARSVTPAYFTTVGVPVLAGRGFTPSDDRETPRVVLVNETFSRQFFRGSNPLGQRITTDRVPDSTSVWRTIVGVVGDERQSELARPARPEMIEPFEQAVERGIHAYVRVAVGDPTTLVPAVRAIVRELDPELPIVEALRMDDVLAEATAHDRFLLVLLSAFALTALVLALVGIYGVTDQAVRQRIPELGLRMALGARAPDVVALSLRRGFGLLVAGLGLGGLAALVATRAMVGVLYGVTPNDPATFAGVAALLSAAGLLASWLPARRAARLDPSMTLRSD